MLKECTPEVGDNYPITNKGDYYISISGSITDGFGIHFYRKLGWDSVTSEHKHFIASYEELLAWLSNKDNLIRDKRVGC